MREKATRFRYTLDPICIGSMVIYAIGRWYLRPHHIGGAFTKDYLNDVLCLPLFTPIILQFQKFLGLREHDLPPRLWEILQHWLVFSVIFEGIIPHFPSIWRSVADPWDVVAYLVGGLSAVAVWNLIYARG